MVFMEQEMKRRTPQQYKLLVKLADFVRDFEAIRTHYGESAWRPFYNKYPGSEKYFREYSFNAILYQILIDINTNNMSSGFVKLLMKG